MANFFVGPTSDFPTIAAAMLSAGTGDSIILESGYSNEAATVLHNGMTVSGDATSTGIMLTLATGIPTFFLGGSAPINVFDASDGNGITANDGDNTVTVTNGIDAVDGGLGVDRLRVDYRYATGAVTGDSTSNVTEAGGRSVTITDGTFEHFTIITGAGADTITTGAGDDYITTREGASTVSTGQGANTVIGGSGADTITALDGGNFIDGRDGTNTLTSGGGNDIILSGVGADTIVAGGGDDLITVRGGADSVNAGAGNDRLLVDYSAMNTNVTGGVTGGDLASGYTGNLADLSTATLDFTATEHFTITTGSGNDNIVTGDGNDVISTGTGDDTIGGAGGDDTLDGGYGTDTLWGGDGTDMVRGGWGDDALNGGNGDDTLVGGNGNDRLRGQSADDALYGGNGDDSLNGGTGQDRLEGGAGLDTFVFSSVDTSPVGAAFRDTVVDFTQGEDHFDLAWMAKTAGVAFDFIGTAAFSNTAGEVRQFSTSSNTFIAGDVDGNGTQDFQIQVAGTYTLTDGDFFL